MGRRVRLEHRRKREVGFAAEPSWTAEGRHTSLPAPPPLQGRNCGDPAETRWGGTHAPGVGAEAVGQHHPLAESLVLVIFLGELGWPVNAKASAIYRGGAPALGQWAGVSRGAGWGQREKGGLGLRAGRPHSPWMGSAAPQCSSLWGGAPGWSSTCLGP